MEISETYESLKIEEIEIRVMDAGRMATEGFTYIFI
jgi:hypothetical protein